MTAPNHQTTSTGDPPDRVPGGSRDGGVSGILTPLIAFAAENKCAVEATALALPPVVDASIYARDDAPPVDAILEDMFDTGDKFVLIGSSKARKTFFLLMLALSLSAGLERFLQWVIPKRRRVLVIQFEIKTAHYHRRVNRACKAMSLAPEAIADWLFIVNARGVAITLDQIGAIARQKRAEVVILDPLYKLLEGDENSAQDMKPLLAGFDRLAETTGAAIVYAHHNGKGFAGDRDARDRGAGSGVLARDFDAAAYLTDHAADDDLLVLSTLLRNYPRSEPVSIAWEDGQFVLSASAPIERTSRNRQTSATRKVGIEEHVPAAMGLVRTGAIPVTVFRERLRTAGLTRDMMRAVVDMLTAGETPQLATFESRAFKKHEKWIGTPEQIQVIRQGQKEMSGLNGVNAQDSVKALNS
jgi:hypothetical protein